MGVASKILKHLLGACKGALCISDPSFFGNRVDQLFKCLLGFKGSDFWGKNQLVFEIGVDKQFKIALFKRLGQRSDFKQIVIMCRYPFVFCKGKRAGGNYAVDVEMVDERL